jgi:hypothetical protein
MTGLHRALDKQLDQPMLPPCSAGDSRALFWLLITTALLGGQLPAAGPAAANPGRLDPSIGTGGKTTTSIAGVLQGGKVVVGSAVNGSGKQTFALARYLS